MRAAILPSALACGLLLAFSSNVDADYTQAGSLLSWEWLTDVSEAIVIGKVSEVDAEGKFQLRVDTVLKQKGKLSAGDVVSGPVLGHAIPYFYELGDPSVAHELGWPVLADASTYPTHSRTNLPSWKPQPRRRAAWMADDRCIVFYGDENDQPLQVINLDKPITIEVPFLAVDVFGKAVDDPAKLIAGIRKRLAAPPQAKAEPRPTPSRFGGTLHYVAWESDLDGADYYGILVPAAEPGVTKRFEKKLAQTPLPARGMREMIWGIHNVSALGAWRYWFDGERARLDFGKDAVLERRYAIEYLLSTRPHFAKEYARWRHRYSETNAVLDQARLYARLRHHVISHRTYPLGWNTLISNDGHRFAYMDANSLWLYEVNQRERRCGLRLHRDRRCDIVHCKMQFSNDNTLLAYNRTDGSVCLVDALEGALLWESEPPLPPAAKAGRPTPEFCGADIHFSHDNRYIAQHFFIDSRPPVRKIDHNAYHRPSKVILWDAKTGRRLFTPYDDFRQRLKFRSFAPEDSDVVVTELDAEVKKWSVAKASPIDAKAVPE